MQSHDFGINSITIIERRILHLENALYFGESRDLNTSVCRVNETQIRVLDDVCGRFVIQASSSSDGSSCDGSSATSSSSLQLPHWYTGERKRRAGVKMGVSSRRSTHSDPETSSCISGSGRSCDTVIHVGRLRTNALSDRDYTDSETGSSVITAVSVRSTPSFTVLFWVFAKTSGNSRRFRMILDCNRSFD